jgi:hypothetical protein
MGAMAPLSTHLVIGERIYPTIRSLRRDPDLYGPFLLGCVLVDVNGFTTGDRHIDRRTTHFVGRPEEDGPAAYQRSCAHFLEQLPALLQRPWDRLSPAGQAFAGGYLCHLAVDEAWKQKVRATLSALGVASIKDIPVPVDVLLTLFDVLSKQRFRDFAAVAQALNGAVVPDIFTHVPIAAFVDMWAVAKPHVLGAASAETYFGMQVALGRSEEHVMLARQQHEAHWAGCVAFAGRMGGLDALLEPAIERAAQVTPALFTGIAQAAGAE